MKVGSLIVHRKRGDMWRVVQISNRRGLVCNDFLVILENLDASAVLVRSLDNATVQFDEYMGDEDGQHKYAEVRQLQAADHVEYHEGAQVSALAGKAASSADGLDTNGFKRRFGNLFKYGQQFGGQSYTRRRILEINRQSFADAADAKGAVQGHATTAKLERRRQSDSSPDAAVLPKVQPPTCG